MFWGAQEGGSLWGCGRASLVWPCPSLIDSGDGIRALCPFCSFPQGTSPVVVYFRHCLAPSRARDTPAPTPTTPTACGASGCGTRPAGSSCSLRTWSESSQAWLWARGPGQPLPEHWAEVGTGPGPCSLWCRQILLSLQAGREQLLLRCHRGVRRRVPRGLAPWPGLQERPSCLHLLQEPAHRPVPH